MTATGAAGEIVDLAGDGTQSLRLRGAYDRHQQTLVFEINGDPDVDEVVDDELFVGHAGIQVRERLERLHDSASDERQVCETEALGRLPFRLHLATSEIDVGEVDLDDAERMWA